MVGGEPLVARACGIAAATRMIAVATSRVVLVVLLLDDGGLSSIRGWHACPQGGGVVAQVALASEQVVLQRGTLWVYLQGIVLEVSKGKPLRELKSRPNPPQV